MEPKMPKIEDWGLSEEALELLWDFRTNPRFYLRWLFHANDHLLKEAIENKDNCCEYLQCMYALRHVRNLLEALQDEDPFEE